LIFDVRGNPPLLAMHLLAAGKPGSTSNGAISFSEQKAIFRGPAFAEPVRLRSRFGSAALRVKTSESTLGRLRRGKNFALPGSALFAGDLFMRRNGSGAVVRAMIGRAVDRFVRFLPDFLVSRTREGAATAKKSEERHAKCDEKKFHRARIVSGVWALGNAL
jgi:hypothetical protein